MVSIVPGLTCTHEWFIPFPIYLITHVRVTYQQNGETVFEQDVGELEEVDFANCKFMVNLSQEDTLKFEQLVPAKVQINVISANGHRVPSTITNVPVGRQFYLEVME